MDNTAPTDSLVLILNLLRLVASGGRDPLPLHLFGVISTNGVLQVAIPALAPIGQYGFLGIPLFFAISGFVIAYSTEGNGAA